LGRDTEQHRMLRYAPLLMCASQSQQVTTMTDC
jgi:hypothetical protein